MDSREENAGPVQAGHGLWDGCTGPGTDDGDEDAGADGGTWGRHLTRGQGRMSLS